MEKRYDAFIGYSRRDFDIVHLISKGLQQRGLTYFIDADLVAPGVEFAEIFSNAINQSRVFVQFYSAAAKQSNWVLNELRYAFNQHIPLLIVLLDDTPTPFDFISVNSTKIDPNNLQESIDKIAQVIKQLSGDKPSPKDAPLTSHKEIETPSSSLREERQHSTKKASGFIWKTVCFILFLIYLFAIPYSFDIGDYMQALLLSTPLLIGLIACFYFLLRNRDYSLKLFCDTEIETDANIEIKVDGELIDAIKPQGVVTINKKKGNYLITASPTTSEIKSISFQHSFTKSNNGEIVEVTLPCKKTNSKNDNLVRYKCFIGGSTLLTSERNAVRAALSRLYNEWENESLIVSAYTFEDFSNAQNQQQRYFDFISRDATCAIFIIADGVGDKTIDEYRLAYETFTKSGEIRPMPFVYADETVSNPEVDKFKCEVLNNGSYWRKYKDTNTLMSAVREDINAELFAIFKMGLKK